MSSTEPKLADPKTWLGQLQRGRRSGFPWALKVGPAEVHELLNFYITKDPRADRQIESRGEYYATLMLRTGMQDLSTIAAHLDKLAL